MWGASLQLVHTNEGMVWTWGNGYAANGMAGEWVGEWVCASPVPSLVIKVYPIGYCILTDTLGMVRKLHTTHIWHGPCPIHRIPTYLSTVWGMSRHNICYQTFPLLSNEIRSALHRPCMLARCMPCTDPHPVIGSPCRPTWCGLSPGSMPNKQKGPMPPTQHIDKRGL